MTTRLLDETIDGTQAETSAFAWRTRGEERLESLFNNFRGHATSIVGNRNTDVVTWSYPRMLAGVSAIQKCVFRLDRDASPFADCIPAVNHKVQDCRLQSTRVDIDNSGHSRQVEGDINPFFNAFLKQRNRFFDQFIYVSRLWLKRLSPGESQKVVSEMSAALGCI